MTTHAIGSGEEHPAARLELLEAEKDLTRRADIAVDQRRLQNAASRSRSSARYRSRRGPTARGRPLADHPPRPSRRARVTRRGHFNFNRRTAIHDPALAFPALALASAVTDLAAPQDEQRVCASTPARARSLREAALC
jgi:hypothetical protein